MFRVIRLGDKTTHGGEVVSAAANYTIMEKNVAREGDKCTCPKKGHGQCEIVGGDPYWSIDGRAVAIQGISKTSCGAELISSCGELTRSFEGEGMASSIGGASNGAGQTSNQQAPRRSDFYDEMVKLLVESTPAQGIPFFIETTDGRIFSGHTDSLGAMPRVDTEAEDTYQVFLYDEALARMDITHGHK